MAQHTVMHRLPTLAAQPASGISWTPPVPESVVKDVEMSYSLPQQCLESVCLCVRYKAKAVINKDNRAF